MEKQGVIKAGITNPEHEPEKTAGAEKKPTAVELDGDFRKHAAQAAHNTVK